MELYGNSSSENLQGTVYDDTVVGNGGNDSLYGYAGNDSLVAGSGDDLLSGGSGNDILYGGSGSDYYFIDSSYDVIVELSSWVGNDTVSSSINFTLGDGLENLILYGGSSSYATIGTGNSLNNIIWGNTVLSSDISGLDGDDTLYGYAGNDVLNGGGGFDLMLGGAGDDTYYVHDLNDTVTENINNGVDWIVNYIDYTLGDNLENLDMFGSADYGAGNDLDNIIRGNGTLSTLMYGYDGNDTLTGYNGNDTIAGGLGVDSMRGGAGDDFYGVEDIGDVVIENLSAGIDTVISSVDFTLGANIENLVLSSTTANYGEGNDLNNSIQGSHDIATDIRGLAGNDTLYGYNHNDSLIGGLGADYMVGGTGNDYYEIDNVGDSVYEAVSGGTQDLISSFINYTLDDNVEYLNLQGAATIGTGNSLDNQLFTSVASNVSLNGMDGNDSLYSGAGNDTLNGGSGVDVMYGSGGDDSYYVNIVSDTVTENEGQGLDRVYSTSTYSLSVNLENLYLQGSLGINATGNNLNNYIAGNGANNLIHGGVGNDSLAGGAGNDTLNGDAGIDRASGGLGDDSYYVNSNSDVITELLGEGLDRVYSTAAYTLSDNLEHLYLQGSSVINGTGNTLNNYIAGNNANNILRGGAGNDSIAGGEGNDTLYGDAGVDRTSGGLGDDTYNVDNSGDVVTELAGQGVDSIFSSVTYITPANVERIYLIGTASIGARGNTLNNNIGGNSGNNALNGAEGNDTLAGFAGNDILTGGLGNDNVQGGLGSDTYMFTRGSGSDSLTDNDTTVGNSDTLWFNSGVSSSQLWFQHVGNHLVVSVIGTTDKVTINNWYLGAANQVENIKASDGKVLLNTEVAALVSAMSAFSPLAVGTTTLPSSYQSTLNPVLAANWS